MMTNEFRKNIIRLTERHGLKNINIEIYEEAFTHPSCLNENKNLTNFQRLEFLGDAVLQLCVSNMIFREHKKFDEGKMSLMRSSIVNSTKLADFSDDLDLLGHARFGKSIKTIDEINLKTKADLFESYVGAIYLDQGQDKVHEFLEMTILKYFKSLHGEVLKNPKTTLQEFLQIESRGNVIYSVKKKNDDVQATVTQDGKEYGVGIGKTKKEAEINAAINALEKVGKNEVD